MASKGSAETLSVVPRVCNVPYGENTRVFMLHFGMNYSAIGHEFNVTESKIYSKVSLNKYKSIYKTRLYIALVTNTL